MNMEANQPLHSISHSKAKKVGFNSEFKTRKIQVASKTELLDYPGEKHWHEPTKADTTSLSLGTCTSAGSCSSLASQVAPEAPDHLMFMPWPSPLPP